MSSIASAEEFDSFFREIVKRTCEQWGYDLPKEDYYTNVYKRLPLGLRMIIASGLSSGTINDVPMSKSKSAAFRPAGLPETKGPYSWFELNNQKRQPQPCWEYFIQVAEYIRLSETLRGKDVTLTFEDKLMDIGIYRNNKLWVCCEIKEKSSQASELIRRLRTFESAGELPAHDRGNDPLRKAKYIARLKPEYFYVVSIGRRFEFRIKYPDDMRFKLVEDLVPLL